MSTFIPEDKHKQVLETCIDVPEEPPSFRVPLQEVGISGKTVWVALTGNRGGHLPFSARILVDLPADRRGIHMSRIEQVITALHDREFPGLAEYGRMLASRVLETQKAGHVSVELTVLLPVIRQAPVRRLNSTDTVGVKFFAELKKEKETTRETQQIGIKVHHLTACPCTLSYNETLFERHGDPCPLSTHSQRSRTELLISTPEFTQLPGYHELAGILAEVLHISQDLLKRPDETELVLKAHRQPQFAEDVVRETARAAGEKFRDSLPPETAIAIKTLSLESIHIHDVECCLTTTLSDIPAASADRKKEHKE